MTEERRMCMSVLLPLMATAAMLLVVLVVFVFDADPD
jgi:hypothetical protein